MSEQAVLTELSTAEYPAVVDETDETALADEGSLAGLTGMVPRAGYRFSRKLFLLSDPTSPEAESIEIGRAHV